MLLRIRWFLLGAFAAASGAVYAVDQLRRARQRLTPENMARSGARGVASLIDAAAERIAPVDSGTAHATGSHPI